MKLVLQRSKRPPYERTLCAAHELDVSVQTYRGYRSRGI